MKFLLIIPILSFMFFATCTDDTDEVMTSEIPTSETYVKLDQAEYPEEIVDYVSQNYSNDRVLEMFLKTYTDLSQIYNVHLSSNTMLYFDDSKAYVGMDNDYSSIDISELPGNITVYVNNNYPNQVIVNAELELEEGAQVYEVYLNNGMELYFNINGQFINAENDRKYIAINELPTSILEYVSTNYSSQTILYAEQDYEDGALIFEVKLSNGIELEFTSDGALISSDQHISISDLPVIIIEYVETNYPNNVIDEVEIEYEDGQEMYKVKLDNDIELYFDMDGNFIKMEED
ncbi:MAG: PepSY-like domain-containing protein [Salinivirgaceae bacterium]|jgi:uncharacterized membrane protein YkoI|nr:PepSY-like domain-containing protein [Salinivirgaceae bacterium]